MSRVFAVQVPARRGGDGRWVEMHDLSDAERFGELIRVLPFGNVSSDAMTVQAQVAEVLSGFDPEADYVLLLGDPVAIAHVAHYLSRTLGGPFLALKWDRRSRSYAPYRVG